MNVTFPSQRRAFAYEAVSATTGAVVSLTAATYGDLAVTSTDNRFPARGAIITVESNSVRVRTDGGNPATGGGAGHLFSAGDVIMLEGNSEIQKFRAIGDSGTASLRVTYVR